VKLPFVSRRAYEDALLDADRKVNQFERAARSYLEERDELKAKLSLLKDRVRGSA
jgi:hypothetical protein